MSRTTVADDVDDLDRRQAKLEAELHLDRFRDAYELDVRAGKLRFFDGVRVCVECDVVEVAVWTLATKDDPLPLLARACRKLEALGGFSVGGTGTVTLLAIMTARAVGPPPARPELALPGRWEGSYQYAGYEDRDFRFIASMAIAGAVVYGHIGDQIGPASVEGTLRGDELSFTKRYAGKPPVEYRGTFDRRARRVEGRWVLRAPQQTIEGTWHMVPQPWWRCF